jgi:ferrous iron transport protein A
MNMPLTVASVGEHYLIKKINGKEEVRRFLENLGFIAGASVSIISEISGNVIVMIKDSRIAISKEMAQKIIV